MQVIRPEPECVIFQAEDSAAALVIAACYGLTVELHEYQEIVSGVAKPRLEMALKVTGPEHKIDGLIRRTIAYSKWLDDQALKHEAFPVAPPPVWIN